MACAICEQITRLSVGFVAAAAVGIVNVLMAFVIVQWKGTLFHLTIQITVMLMSPVSGLFIVGMLFRFCNTKVCEKSHIEV